MTFLRGTFLAWLPFCHGSHRIFRFFLPWRPWIVSMPRPSKWKKSETARLQHKTQLNDIPKQQAAATVAQAQGQAQAHAQTDAQIYARHQQAQQCTVGMPGFPPQWYSQKIGPQAFHPLKPLRTGGVDPPAPKNGAEPVGWSGGSG